MNCRICQATTRFAFNAKVLAKHDASFSYCVNCGFLGAEKPYWLDEAYQQAVSSTDTGMVSRNLATARKLAAILLWLGGRPDQEAYIDVAGGWGLLTRLMRDNGFDFYWSDKYCQNFFAEGFEAEGRGQKYFAATAFEVIEHLPNPVEFVRDIFTEKQVEHLIFSTILFAGQPPPGEWWYYSFETGQHVSFFQRRTLVRLGEMLGLHLASAGDIHIFSKKPVNERILRIVAGRLSHLLALLARRKLGSRTMDDHRKIVASLQDAASRR